MLLKKYLVIDRSEVPVVTDDYNFYEIKCKIVKGFLRSDIDNVFNAQDTFTPIGNNKDKLYFFPGCSVPRFKVRSLFNVTIKPQNATGAFISKDGLTGSDNSLIHYRNLLPLPFKVISSFMHDLTLERSIERFDTIIKNNPDIESIYITSLIWDKNYFTGGVSRYGAFKDYISDNKFKRYQFKNICNNNEYQLLAPIHNGDILKLNCPIYLEESLLKLLNVGNIEISEEKYNELRSFGKTKEKENQLLMMELMSNCDFEKSIFYLLALLKEFGKDILLLKEKDHVNFKSLLTFLNISEHNLGNMSIHRMTLVLKEHKKFTRDNAMKLAGLCRFDSVKLDIQDSHWETGIVLKEEYENQLNE